MRPRRIRIYLKSTALERNIAQGKNLEDPVSRETRIENLTKYYEMVQAKLDKVDMDINFNCLVVDYVINAPMSKICHWKNYRKAQSRKMA